MNGLGNIFVEHLKNNQLQPKSDILCWCRVEKTYLVRCKSYFSVSADNGALFEMSLCLSVGYIISS